MSLKMHITATEHGVVRLFALETAQRFDHPDLIAALGVEALDETHVDILSIADLDELGLEGYLTQGMGIPAPEVEAMRAQVNSLKGDVVLIRSAAFGGRTAELSPKAPLRWIASFGEVPLDTTAKPIKTRSAQRTISSPVPAKPRSNSRVLFWVLIAFGAIVLITLSMFIRIAS